jgi:hypothetical protein
MIRADEQALEVVETTVCLLEEIASSITDSALSVYAVRGTRLVDGVLPPREMLVQVWTTAHIVGVRLDRLLREDKLTPGQAQKAIAYRGQIDRLIRGALYTLHPEKYAFCGSES